MIRAGLLWMSLTALAATGCWQLRAGFCDESHMNCGDGYTCNMQNHKCEAHHDGGAGDADASHDAHAEDAAHDAPVDLGPPPCSVDAHDCGPATPVCDPVTRACRGCQVDDECAKLDPTKPACLVVAGTPGVCVACTDNKHCGASTPVCDQTSNSCTGCSLDSDCQRFGPGICKSFVATVPDAGVSNRGCLADAEAIFVQNGPSCSDTPMARDGGADAGVAGGTASVPFCSMEPVRAALSKDRFAVVVRGSVAAGTWTYTDQAAGNLLIVGQQNALLGSSGAPAFNMSSGTVTIRDLSFTSLLSMGIQATGGMLTLDHVKVDGCKTGGILLNGATFEIRNSVVTNNGVGMDGAVVWSGVYVKTAPAGTKKLYSSTVAHNKNVGVQCTAVIDGMHVQAFLNDGNIDIGAGCGFTSCGGADAGLACGAQP